MEFSQIPHESGQIHKQQIFTSVEFSFSMSCPSFLFNNQKFFAFATNHAFLKTEGQNYNL